MWAHGNLYLLWNTMYILLAYADSLGLMFELPVFIRAFRVTRMIGFASAIVYNIMFLLSFFEWWDQLYIVTDKSQYDFVTIFINMILGYNIWLHGSIIPINLIIIIKEISLNYFTVLDESDGRNETNVALNGKDLQYAEKDVEHYADPFTYVDYAYDPITGHDVEDDLWRNRRNNQ